MTEISQQDHELIRQYLAGSLTGEEEAMVETRIVRDAKFRSELELTAAFRQGLRQLERSNQLEGLLAGKPGGWRRPALSIAASLGVLGLATSIIVSVFDTPRRAGAPTAEVPLYFEQTRSTATRAPMTWQRGATPVQLHLHLDVGAAPAAAYRVAILRHDDGGAVTVAESVEQASAAGEIVLTIPDSRLEAGRFEIRLTPLSESAAGVTIPYLLVVTDR